MIITEMKENEYQVIVNESFALFLIQELSRMLLEKESGKEPRAASFFAGHIFDSSVPRVTLSLKNYLDYMEYTKMLFLYQK